MTMIARYPTKKALKASIGKRLDYIETSVFGKEYLSNGDFVVCNRPYVTGMGREWFAHVWVKDDVIIRVE